MRSGVIETNHLAYNLSAQTTFCSALIQHLRLIKRSCFYINLDPAAEDFAYEPDLDIKDLISLEDVMEEVGLGPNGGLIYCFEYDMAPSTVTEAQRILVDCPRFLLENLDFLSEAIEPLSEEYLIIIDMPGQIELYTHVPVVPTLVQHLTRTGALHINLCAAYLLESTFVIDRAKFFAGTLSAMSAMLMLELPHVNIMSKMDLVKGSVRKKDLKRFIDPDTSLLDDETDNTREATGGSMDDLVSTEAIMGGGSFKKLNKAVAKLIEDFSMVSFLQLYAQNEDSVGAILSYIDDAIQYHEAQEPREPNDELQDWEETAMK